ncbi:hypothetical protein CTA2_5528 [Colletotrichum tanaceti]|uniref:2EXR domain-containing protein n=1 Tax=Colletotrichum tanaceti TaxID=1306861 RepID=A0A4U6XT95_9PEZI|nr:hypothetical protein CTA2_5528 [Colletotrichum tanaceti]TKW59088.1 hypothetical protein CTA1_13344 [Colletotrichum tanaceti]
MATRVSFPLFPNLPTELRVNIWEETVSSPSIHIVDVCFPSRRGNDRSKRAFEKTWPASNNQGQSARWRKYENSVFLDSMEVATGDDQLSGQHSRLVHYYVRDPSVYRQRRAQRLTCSEAASSSALRANRANTVYLSGRGSKFDYDNGQDVLFLRFWDRDLPMNISGITEVLEAPWSAEMALTVHQARRIAIDVNDATIMPSSIGEVPWLASCFQQGLEVLYLVDHQVNGGGGDKLTRDRYAAVDLQTRGGLYRQLHGSIHGEDLTRAPDLIHGVGKTYREVFDLERLLWSESHPAFIFARHLEDSIRSQQRDAGAEEFKGVRGVVIEDETRLSG